MKCIYCGTPLSAIDFCTGCGADITIQKRIMRISNLLYNEGLEKATVRDLSGAIVCLKRSLKFNKENIDARNLLGLVYYEMGEVVSSLSEWVLSKNLQVPDNAADGYINKLQANKSKLDTINQSIRKYNQALMYCRQDNEDMAVIQLKKILVQNPKLIKGYHLLALLYLRHQDYEKARKLLKKAMQIDATNTTSLRYLHEIEEATGIVTRMDVKRHRRYPKDRTSHKFTGPLTYLNGNDTVIQPTPFREGSAVATFINIFLGLILGGSIVWFLIVPSNKQRINQAATKQVTEANTKLASETAKNQKLNDEIEEYKKNVDAAAKTMEDANNKAKGYEQLLKASGLYVAGDQTGAATELADVDEKLLEGSAKDLYDKLTAGVKDTMYAAQFNEGAAAYQSGDYKTAVEKLTKASETDPTAYDAQLYLAFSYVKLKDTANADKIFKQIIKNFPDKTAEITPYITNPDTGTSQTANGTAGTTPDAGTNGTTGDAGTNGTTGDAGANGATPDAGTNGTTGDAGANGATPDAGVNGTTPDALGNGTN